MKLFSPRTPRTPNYQAQFQQRWPHLNHPHVRSLAWLLDSSILLNTSHSRWDNQLAQLPPVNQTINNWLTELEQDSEPLVHFLALHPHTRLGHYAEHLLAFYFKWSGELVAHSVQVRSHRTIGEFDFLLNTASGLQHWEFACKFYLLVAPETKLSNYVGPNLMDNLNDKSHKIMDAQLILGQHPDAQKYLPAQLSAAKALLKGWLFYPATDTDALGEVAPLHCRGLWCRITELQHYDGDCFAILSRLKWLAPAKAYESETMSRSQLHAFLEQQFLSDSRPVLIAHLVPDGEYFVETERIFVVPDAWNLDSSILAISD
ncbi:DUF1853 family protein [Solimicrobium silvestre]|uniref:DUF1853 domain-containing protein n=1 Tax=Solimicrobium silvestre TaxID=2099400 RepID=A0A2S9GUW8_9BURK|nr:DUF1853 family protein [Solimicrobium silvestre]PRC91510.1 hypothetical protein S2091_3788 [Solimicrobium silvestre]